MRLLLLALLPLSLTGCVVGTLAGAAVDVATLPVKVAAAGIDAATTSQAEADRNRGRAIRQMEERCRKNKPRPTDECPTFQVR
jgi:hypothetical protein